MGTIGRIFKQDLFPLEGIVECRDCCEECVQEGNSRRYEVQSRYTRIVCNAIVKSGEAIPAPACGQIADPYKCSQLSTDGSMDSASRPDAKRGWFGRRRSLVSSESPDSNCFMERAVFAFRHEGGNVGLYA